MKLGGSLNQHRYNKIMRQSYKNNFVTNVEIKLLNEKNKKSFFSDKKLEILIDENLYQILDHRAKEYLPIIVNEMLKYDNTKFIIERKFFRILNEASLFEMKNLLNLEYYFDIDNIINDNFDYLLETFNIDKLILLNYKIKLNKENKNKLNNIFNENIICFIDALFNYNLIYICEEEKAKNKVIDIIRLIIDELIVSENVNLADIKKLQSGSYSKVIQIGNKILKVGIERKTFNIPNSKYILKPIIRKNLREISSIPVVIEVSEKVDTNVKLDNDKLYEFYEKLRNNGIIYGDLKNENIGILLKDNKIYYNNISYDYKNRGFLNDCYDILEKGNIVIIDLDYIYLEDDKDIEYPSSLSKQFEERYLDENKKYELKINK